MISGLELDAFSLFDEPFDLFVNRRHRLAGGTADPADLLAETLLIDTGCEMVDELSERLKAMGLADMRRHQAAAQDDVLALLEANLGIAVMPIGAAQSDGIARVPLAGLNLVRRVSAYCVAGRRRTPAGATLLNMLRAAEWPTDRTSERNWKVPYGASRA